MNKSHLFAIAFAVLLTTGCPRSEMSKSTLGADACQPDCADKECGTDGCDGWCGFCGAYQQCVQYTCIHTSPDSDADLPLGLDATDSGPVTPDGDPGVPDEKPEEPTVTYKGTLIGFGTDLPTADATIDLLDQRTGQLLGVQATTDWSGEVTFTGLPASKPVAFLARRENHKDTYQFHGEPGETDGTLWIVPDTVYTLAMGLAGLNAKPDQGALFGAVYFVDEAGEEIPLGCLDITIEKGSGDIRYMDGNSGLPTTLEKQEQTHPAHGRFLVGNLEPGIATIWAWAGDGPVGALEVHVVENAVVVNDIIAEKSLMLHGIYGSPVPWTFEALLNAGACIE